jgi:nitroreductase
MNAEPILAPHRSVRVFRPGPLPEGMLERIVREGQRAPTDATAQMYSFVRVTSGDVRRRIAEFSGDQSHVAAAAESLVVCADLHRLEAVLESRGCQPGTYPATGLHFAIVDATLAAQRLVDAAEALGLGTVCIGGILNGIEELVGLLALPRGVLPLFGLCLGWPGEAPVERPRVDVASVLHTDRYQGQTPEAIYTDVATMAAITRSGDWIGVLARYFASGGTMEQREGALRRVLERQGFAW